MTSASLILCAVDFSTGSRVALTTAAWLSRRLGVRLVVATVVDTLPAQTESAVHLGHGRVDDAREAVVR